MGTLLLEQLTAIARHQGITILVGDVLATNAEMLEVSQGFAPAGTSRDGDVVRVKIATLPGEAALLSLDHRDRTAQRQSLHPLMAPRSVAVVGAGRHSGGVGHEVLRSIVDGGFTGRLFAINPHAHDVLGVPSVASVRDLPASVDLAILAIPAPAVAAVLSDCVDRGVRSALVLSSGFSESGDTDRQSGLLRIVRGGGIRVAGPNCLGLTNTDPAVQLHATFAVRQPVPGSLAVASQSGGVGMALVDGASDTGVGVSTFVSLGNKADVSTNDLLAYWYDDERTAAVALYVESFGNPARFSRLAQQIGRHKPVLVIKSGRSVGGQRAGISHTAAAATADAVVDSLFAQAGVIRVRDPDELLDAARMLIDQPSVASDRLGVVGNAGGISILAADEATEAGLRVDELSASLAAGLRRMDPAAAGLSNPVDLGSGAAPSVAGDVVTRLVHSGEIDALVVCLAALRIQDPTAVLGAVAVALDDAPQIPAAVVLVGLPDPPVSIGRRRVPVYGSAERAVRALGHAARYARWRATPVGNLVGFVGIRRARARELTRDRLAAGGGWLAADGAAQILECHGVRTVPAETAGDADAAVQAAGRLGYPVAVKTAQPDVVHKSDIGAVRLDLRSEVDVRAAHATVQKAVDDPHSAVLVQRMAPAGLELIAGIHHDPLFGPVIMLGLGGVEADLRGDRALHLLPFTDRDAAALWRSLHGAPLLTGYRGAPPVDTDAVEELLLRLAQLAGDLPEVAELDLNPVIASEDGAIAVDVKIRLADPGAEPDPYVRALHEPS
ncbi:MAG: acetate--CoA ligase family protein [Actinocatenispora sp.]